MASLIVKNTKFLYILYNTKSIISLNFISGKDKVNLKIFRYNTYFGFKQKFDITNSLILNLSTKKLLL